MIIDYAVLEAIRKAKQKYGNFGAVAQVMGKDSDRALIKQYLRTYAQWQKGVRNSQPEIGDVVWARFWKVLHPFLGREYAPLSERLATLSGQKIPGDVNIFSREQIDMVCSLEMALAAAGPSSADACEQLDGCPGVSFGFTSSDQEMDGYGIEDDDIILCGPATSANQAEACSLVACYCNARCLVRLLDRHGDEISLISTKGPTLLWKAHADDIGWVAPVVEIRINPKRRKVVRYVPRRTHNALMRPFQTPLG